MPINKMNQVPYNDFKLLEVIDPDIFDANNAALVTKIDEIVDDVNGKATTVTNLTNTVNANETDIENKMTSLTNTVNANETDIESKVTALTTTVNNNETDIENKVTTLTNTVNTNESDIENKVATLTNTVNTNETDIENKITTLTGQINTHKTSADHDGRYYTETETNTLLNNHKASADHDTRYVTQTSFIQDDMVAVNDCEWVATEGQTLFTIAQGAYPINRHAIQVSIGGVLQPSTAFTETSTTSITLSEGVPAGTVIAARWFSVVDADIINAIHAQQHAPAGNDSLAAYYAQKSVVEAHEAENANKAHGGFKGVLLIKTSEQSIANNTMTFVTFNETVYDSDGFFNIANPTRITIPEGVSKVKISASTWWGNSSTGVRHLRIKKNGAFFAGYGYISYTANTASPGQVSTGVIDVSPGDYFEFEVMQTSGGALGVNVGSAEVTWFNLEVVE